MLSKKYRYVAMDFETTGLDIKKDEAIQIGLIEIDSDGNEMRRFKSFIKPQKDVEELKSLVSYITGISISDINSAPTIYQLEDEIMKFFGENVVLIGHNIKFDIDFLKKYFPNILYFNSVDTFYLAQNLIHFPLSYALDVLVEFLMSNKIFKEIFLKIHNGKDLDLTAIHDGLYDSQNSIALFLYEIYRMKLLFNKYPELSQILVKTNGVYCKILENNEENNNIDNQTMILLPPLKKQLPSDMSLKTKLQIPLQNCKNGERYYIGNIEMKQLIMSLVSSNKNIILAFSNLAKLNIVKNVLNDAGIKNIGFAKGYETINQDKFARFLNKNKFSDDEFLFVVKYLSHVMNEGSVLDLNTKMDYKINYYIHDEQKFENYPVILSTHGGLYSILKPGNHKYQDYEICFFDLEMRYKGYNDFQSQSVDLYSILNFLDVLFYKYSLDESSNAMAILEGFASFFEIFMGVLFSETKKCFENIQDTKITLNPILENINFFETNKLILQFSKHRAMMQECLENQDFEDLWSLIDHFFSVISGIVDVKKIMYNQSEFYFTYGESTKYTNWEEFKDVFSSPVYFFSDFEKNYPKLLNESFEEKRLNIKKISEMNSVVSFLLQYMQEFESKTIFVLSTVKAESKELFDKLYGAGICETLLVENITGSLGKNVFKAKSNGTKIIIGGYSFLMRMFSNKINIDIFIDFNITGKMSKYLLEDIQWYAI